jgi:probable HAF family extracellular repeat protein
VIDMRRTLSTVAAIAVVWASPAATTAVYASDTATYTITDLGRGEAYGINDSGHVVGLALIDRGVPSPPKQRAFLWDQQAGLSDLGVLGGYDSSIAYGVNNDDLVVGASAPSH